MSQAKDGKRVSLAEYILQLSWSVITTHIIVTIYSFILQQHSDVLQRRVSIHLSLLQDLGLFKDGLVTSW